MTFHSKIFLVSSKFSSRLEYVILLWNTQILSPQLIYSPKIPKDYPYIEYSQHSLIPNSNFLFSQNIDFEINRIDYSQDFPTFDFFSYIFALATECYYYQPNFPKDAYNRYDEKYNPLIIHELHKIPFFPFWAKKICHFFNIPITFYPPEPLWITLDIDNPFHFQFRGYWAQTKSLLKDILTLNFPEIMEKMQILLGFKNDPFMVENWYQSVKNFHYLVFFLMNHSALNSNTSPHNPHYHQEILKIPAQNLGVHFSLNTNGEGMMEEKKILEQIIKNAIFKSRQHFLWYELPYTFQNLIQMGIYQDYTTCFYSQKGFKHGLVRPFPWYDLTQEKTTSLLRFPVFFMDRHSLKESMSLQETIEYIQQQTLLIQSYGGIPIILLHNETFSNKREWKGFKLLGGKGIRPYVF